MGASVIRQHYLNFKWTYFTLQKLNLKCIYLLTYNNKINAFIFFFQTKDTCNKIFLQNLTFFTLRHIPAPFKFIQETKKNLQYFNIK